LPNPNLSFDRLKTYFFCLKETYYYCCCRRYTYCTCRN